MEAAALPLVNAAALQPLFDAAIRAAGPVLQQLFQQALAWLAANVLPGLGQQLVAWLQSLLGKAQPAAPAAGGPAAPVLR